jgi:hypothetical protein
MYSSEKFGSQKDCEKRQRMGFLRLTRHTHFPTWREKAEVEQYFFKMLNYVYLIVIS